MVLKGREARTGVSILNYRSTADTATLLESLERSNNLDMDLLVVDNGPADSDHRELVAAIDGRAAVVASGDNLGYARGNNIAIRSLVERGCEFVWVLNPDTIVEPSTLTNLIRHMDAVPDCAVVGPRILFTGTGDRIWSDGGVIDLERFGATYHRASRRSVAETHKEPGSFDVDYVPGASALFRASALERLGLLPEHYFLYFEETDWCVRARRAGWRVMTDSRAWMKHSGTSGGPVPKPYFLYYMTRNRYRFVVDVLGLDGVRMWEEMGARFHAPLRASVENLAPDWLVHFDELVAWGKRDAMAGVTGRVDEIMTYPTAVPQAGL
jgi:GT2 family glycosyltransferase